MSWNGLAISAFARASMVLRKETEEIKFNFPVTGCDVSYYHLSLCHIGDLKSVVFHLFLSSNLELLNSEKIKLGSFGTCVAMYVLNIGSIGILQIKLVNSLGVHGLCSVSFLLVFKVHCYLKCQSIR